MVQHERNANNSVIKRRHCVHGLVHSRDSFWTILNVPLQEAPGHLTGFSFRNSRFKIVFTFLKNGRLVLLPCKTNIDPGLSFKRNLRMQLNLFFNRLMFLPVPTIFSVTKQHFYPYSTPLY